MSNDKAKTNVQGEGDREAARRFNKQAEEFARSEEGREAMEKGPGLSGEDAGKAEESERKGRERAKEKDPQVVRDYRESEK